MSPRRLLQSLTLTGLLAVALVGLQVLSAAAAPGAASRGNAGSKPITDGLGSECVQTEQYDDVCWVVAHRPNVSLIMVGTVDDDRTKHAVSVERVCLEGDAGWFVARVVVNGSHTNVPLDHDLVCNGPVDLYPDVEGFRCVLGNQVDEVCWQIGDDEDDSHVAYVGTQRDRMPWHAVDVEHTCSTTGRDWFWLDLTVQGETRAHAIQDLLVCELTEIVDQRIPTIAAPEHGRGAAATTTELVQPGVDGDELVSVDEAARMSSVLEDSELVEQATETATDLVPALR